VICLEANKAARRSVFERVFEDSFERMKEMAQRLAFPEARRVVEADQAHGGPQQDQ